MATTIDLIETAENARRVAELPKEAQHAVMLQFALIALHEIRKDRQEREEDRERQGRLPTWARDSGWQDYCIAHGTFIGDPYGADYMCAECESGESEYETALGLGRTRLYMFIDRFREQQNRIAAIIDLTVGMGYQPTDDERARMIEWAVKF